MTESTQKADPAAPQKPPVEAAPTSPFAALVPGRIVLYRDPMGVEQVAIVTKVYDENGTVNLCAFATEAGQEPVTLEQGVRYDEDGTGFQRWRWPARKAS
jgi:hypothetical protein